jgi:hypothetical protein
LFFSSVHEKNVLAKVQNPKRHRVELFGKLWYRIFWMTGSRAKIGEAFRLLFPYGPITAANDILNRKTANLPAHENAPSLL